MLTPIFAALSLAAVQDESDLLLPGFIGDWEGEAVAYNPLQPERGERREDISAICRPVLSESYVQCDARWSAESGTSRELLIFWNALAEVGRYEILYLYDNWPGKVQYPLDFDSDTRTLTGYSQFEAGDRTAEERVRWIFSEDGNVISSEEHVRYEGDPDWLLSFEFTWRRR